MKREEIKPWVRGKFKAENAVVQTSMMFHNVPRDVKKRFKQACKDNNKNMKDVIVGMMDAYAKHSEH